MKCGLLGGEPLALGGDLGGPAGSFTRGGVRLPRPQVEANQDEVLRHAGGGPEGAYAQLTAYPPRASAMC